MAQEFEDASFWDKIKNFGKAAGKEVIEKALWLYFAAQRPDTPLWAKTMIYSALVYFVIPIDAVPDLIPVAGYTDDVGALAAAIGTVSMYITPVVKAQAQEKMNDIFRA